MEFAFFLLGASPPFPLFFFPFFFPALPFHPGLLSCRDKPALLFAAHPPIIPNTENTVGRYYYYRLWNRCFPSQPSTPRHVSVERIWKIAENHLRKKGV